MRAAKHEGRTFFSRLRRDRAGNTLAIMAAALIPFAGMVGGGIDLARMYLTKTRLQHGCDAGALAGRKAMGGGLWSQNSYAPRDTALQFFRANFADGSYGSSNTKIAYAESSGKVSGVASADLPMTLTRVIGFTSQTLSVVCDAEMRLPNTDVMFVLDNTGSMASKAVATDSQTKIEALRSSVKCFFEIVARLDTDENCVGGAPSGGLSSQVQVRFGFVPYSTNVNVGRLLPSNWFADRWPYQTRERAKLYGTLWYFDGTTRNVGGWTGYTTETTRWTGSSSACNTLNYPLPDDSYVVTGDPSSWPDQETDASWRAYQPYRQRNYRLAYDSSSKNCLTQYRERNLERRAYYQRGDASTSGAIAFNAWTYKQVSLDISGLKNGAGWNAGVTLPIGNNFTDMTASWDGCIEERATVRQTSYDPIPSGARDLDVVSTPDAGNPDTLWGPALPAVIFPRKTNYSNSGANTLDTVTTFQQGFSGESYYCPAEARKMTVWSDADAFDSYVDSLTPTGNTYHDIGLIWGARLMWPTGLFRSENEFTPQGGEIQRHMIFMTDGDACTAAMNYIAYGISWYDRRQTDPAVVPTEGCTTTGTLTQQVNARTQGLCTKIRNENITLWVIWFGAANNTIEGMLKNCATSGRYFAARNQADLQNTFRTIANQISQLRLTN